MSLRDQLLAEGEKHKGTDLGGLLQNAAFQIGDLVQFMNQARHFIAADRATFAQGCTAPNGAVEPEDWVYLAHCDVVLKNIDATLYRATTNE